MEASDMSKASESLTDVMYRRLMNRERQRRYRERKRLRADASNAHVSNSPASDPSLLQIFPLPINGTMDHVVTRVHCTRDWKKDARRVYVAPNQATSNGFSSNEQSLMGENHPMNSSSGTREAEQSSISGAPLVNSVQMENSDKPKSKLGRRAWKAEARSKK